MFGDPSQPACHRYFNNVADSLENSQRRTRSLAIHRRGSTACSETIVRSRLHGQVRGLPGIKATIHVFHSLVARAREDFGSLSGSPASLATDQIFHALV